MKKTSGGTEAPVTLSATAPVISGKTVTLTLATALVSTDTAVKVSYTKPTTGSANKLVDAASNATADFTDQPVTNNTPAAQTVTTFISNTGQTDVSGGLAVTSDFSYAQQFTTGGNPGGYTLSAVVVDIRTGSSTATQTSALHQSTTVGGVEVPGTKVVDLSGSITTAGEQSFTPASTTTLSASTKYFVVLSIDGSTLTIHRTSSDDEDSGGSPGWEIANNSLRASNPVNTWTSVSDKLEIAVKGTSVPDTTAPAFESAAANGTSLVITFDENLAAAASLANGAFTVKKTPSGGSEATVTLSTTTAPVISGKTVTLTLATALASTDGSIKVSYTKPTTGSANKLVDAADNATADFTDQPVTNNTAPALPVITIAAGTSPVTEGTAAAFTLTRTGSATAELSVNVTVSESGDMVASANEGAKTATFAANSATAALSVATVGDSVDETNSVVTATVTAIPATYTVGTPASATVTVQDNDTRGVTVSAATLTVNEGSTGTYTVKLDSQPTASVTVTPSKTGSSDVTFAPASLTFLTSNWSATQTVTVTAADDSDAADDSATISHAVAGGDYGSVTAASVVVTVDDDETADTTAPAFASAAANGTSLVITFDENLAAAASLANSAFTVEKTPSGGSEATVTLSTTVAPVISGKTVTLTLATALVSTDTAVKVSYTAPATGSANKLVDAAANATADFTDQTVTNNTPAVADTTPPTLSSATVASAGDQITLTFNESLDGANPPLRSAFRVTADGAVIPIGSADNDFLVGSSGLPAVVFLRNLSPLIRAGQAVVVTYTDPTSGNDTAALQDAAGNDTAAFTTGRNGVPAFTNSSGVAAVAPGAPTSLIATASGTTRINLSWNAPADNGGRTISGYKIEWSAAGSDPWTILVATTGSAATTYSNTGLTAGTTRHYRVSAINSVGTGTASNTDSATTSTRVSTPPTSQNSTVTTNEDTDYTFTTTNFPFSDTDTGDTLMNVKITELPATGKGTLTLDTTAITTTDLPKTVTKADLDANKLKYSPPADENGSRYASFKFKVNDGSADSASAYTMTINVTPVNDAATGTPSITGNSKVGNTLTASTSDIIDVEGLPSSFTYQWKRFAADGTTFEANIGTNSRTYTLTSSEEGKKVKVEVSFTDDGGTREGPLVSSAFPSSGTVTVPTSDSLNVGGLGVYWHDRHENGGNQLRMDSCTGVKVFQVIWDGPDGNRRADEWAAEITAPGGSRALIQNFRETPGNPGYFELDGRMLLAGPDTISIRVRGRFGSTWGTWSPTASLYCIEIEP